MMRRMNSGERDLSRMPVAPHSLSSWEFFAVLKGQCGVTLKTGEKLPLRKECLWIFPADFVHGWHGDGQKCSVISFQVAEPPVHLIAATRVDKFLEHPLLPEEAKEITGLRNVIKPDFQTRDMINELRFDRAIIQMSLMALAGVTVEPEEFTRLRTEKKVHEALRWFKKHIKEQPTVREIAAAVEISSTSLRRFFIGALNKKPYQVLTEIQLEVATALLETTDLKLASVAAKAGFGSSRAFVRVFTTQMGCSPRVWRLKVRAMTPNEDNEPAQNITGQENASGPHGNIVPMREAARDASSAPPPGEDTAGRGFRSPDRAGPKGRGGRGV